MGKGKETNSELLNSFEALNLKLVKFTYSAK